MTFTIVDEKIKKSHFSPSVVCDKECLLRLSFVPKHIDNDGNIIPNAIAKEDLSCRGFSVDRKDHIENETIVEKANNFAAKSPENHRLSFISELVCLDIRNIIFDHQRAFVVIDDGTSNNIAHACIFSAKKRTKSDIRKIRILLAKILNDNKKELTVYLSLKPHVL